MTAAECRDELWAFLGWRGGWWTFEELSNLRWVTKGQLAADLRVLVAAGRVEKRRADVGCNALGERPLQYRAVVKRGAS